ncbi:MAG: CaiB/BaiF CoA-transferase family protein [Acetobacteraceae bacterium]|nr:CaiB/BaiF CoA-transferase family protein [Acetobacteraceae bacterium]
MRRPLEGLLVLSLEQAVAAPYCSGRLADAGARVIKVERPEGDFARKYDRAVGDLSSYFVWLNRGKQSLVADIKAPDDAALLHRILARADVFIQNLAPGAADRAGFGSAALRDAHPRLITMDISGYGDTPAYQSMKAYDLLVQAETGLASITGHPAGPGRVGVSIVDVGCGMSAHAAILEALIERGITGMGKQLSTSLFAATADWMTVPLLYTEGTGSPPVRLGLAHPSVCPYGAFALSDGSLVLISIQNEREWAQFCTVFLGEPDLPTKAGFETNVARVKNRDGVEAKLSAIFVTLDRETVRTRLLAANTAFGFVNDVPALAGHPALRRIMIETPSGPAHIVCPPVTAAGEDVSLGPVPSIGEHTQPIRADFA